MHFRSNFGLKAFSSAVPRGQHRDPSVPVVTKGVKKRAQVSDQGEAIVPQTGSTADEKEKAKMYSEGPTAGPGSS